MKKVGVAAVLAGMMLMVSGCSGGVDEGTYSCTIDDDKMKVVIDGDTIDMISNGKSMLQQMQSDSGEDIALILRSNDADDDYSVFITGTKDGKSVEKKMMSLTPKGDDFTMIMGKKNITCLKQ